VLNFFVYCCLHAREIKVKHRVVGHADARVRDVFQGQRNTIAEGCDDMFSTGDTRF
jgi:hypothetical protein